MANPRLIYLVTEDWYFMSHRLPMARAAAENGYEVHVATRVDRHGDAIVAEKFHLHPVDLHRGSINPFKFAAAIFAVRRLYRALKPDLVHHITLQVAVVGSIASLGLDVPQVNSFFGFGSAFSADTLKSRIARFVLRILIPPLMNRRTSLALVVNPEQRVTLEQLGVAAARITVFPGSGVDVERFSPLPEPPPPITAGYAGRMLEDKGVRTLVEAHRKLRDRGHAVQLLLAGTPDPANPNSISANELSAWAKIPGVQWLGHVKDVRTVWAKSHIAVLPSRAEGLPLSLLEAAACGRPLVASDIAGCREVARPGHNAILVPTDNADALADAMMTLVRDDPMRRAFGAAGRRIVEAEFSTARIKREIVAIYDRLARPSG